MKKSSKRHHWLVEFIGWAGVILILTAYFGVSFGYLSPEHNAFYLLNAVGSVGIVVDAYTKKDYQPVFLNVVWLAIALIGLLR